jgi:hypothetical protein
MIPMTRASVMYEHVVRAIDDLTPLGKNARTHSDQQIAKLAAAIRHFGFTAPILIDEKNRVFAGAGRLMAAREIPLTQVPCIVIPGLTMAQKRALAISDNKLATESTWNQDILIETLGEISADNFDLTLTGFDPFEVETMLFPSSFDEPDEAEDGKDRTARMPMITVSVPSAINIPSVAAILRKAVANAGFKGVRVKEPK